MSYTRLGLLLLLSFTLLQYNTIGQDRFDPLGLQSKTSVLDSIREGKFSLGQEDQSGLQLAGEQLKEQNKWMDGAGAIVPMVQDHFIRGENWPKAETFHMVVIGDSIAWGCGLNQYEKYSYLVADWLQGVLERPVDVTVLAHTGATLEEPKKIEKKHNFLDPELSSWDPTISEQAEHIGAIFSNPDDVDLILVSGGINDVRVDTILNPLPSSDLSTACASIQEPISKILIELLNKFPKSKIVVTSYFPIVSQDTPQSALNDFAKKLSLDHPDILTRFGASLISESPNTKVTLKEKVATLVLDAAASKLMSDQSKKFGDLSKISLSSAVGSANKYSTSTFHEERVIFAPVNFPSYASYGTSGSWLWKLEDIENGGKTDDHKFADRTSLCDITYRSTCTWDDMIEAINNPNAPSPCNDYSSTCNWDDKINAIGHPNAAGAQQYFSAIQNGIKKAWPYLLKSDNLPSVGAFGVEPTSLTLGDSCTISYDVSDSGGSGLKQVELWRKDESSDWQEIKPPNTLAGETGPLTGSFTDSPSAPGKYWYGVHVVDNAGNWNDERNSNTNGLPSSFEPVEVEVIAVRSARASSHAPSEEWNKTFGGDYISHKVSVQLTKNGDYILAGTEDDLSSRGGTTDAFLTKIDSKGQDVWSRTFGDKSCGDEANSVQPTPDGGYILAGLKCAHFAWLIKTDSEGQEVWSKIFGKDSWSQARANSVQTTTDGGYILAVDIEHGGALLIKTDSEGNELWNRTFDKTGEAFSVQQTNDNGYIMVAYIARLIKTDSEGNELWNRAFGINISDSITSVQQTSDGGYILAGGKVDGSGSKDAWLIKTDSEGNELWDRTFGGVNYGWANSVKQTNDGGYILAGVARPNGVYYEDVWLIKTDSHGNEIWNETFGGAKSEEWAYSVQPTPDGGYILAGTTESLYPGYYNSWLIKIAAP